MKPDIQQYFTDDEISLIKQEAPLAEKQGQWTSKMFQIIEQKRISHLLIPNIYGGQELPLPAYLPWLECASWLDGSFGWNLTLSSGAGIFAAYMNPDIASKIFHNNTVFISGSGFPGGTADKQEDGSYKVNGHWKYASGLEKADIITASCYVEQNGIKLFNDGKAVIKAVTCYPDEIDIKGDWNSLGLKATNTLDFEIDEAQIPADRVFDIDPDSSFVDSPLYKFPFDPFARCTLAISFLGMGERFLHEAKNLILEKHNTTSINDLPDEIREYLSHSNEKIASSREKLLNIVDNAWKKLEKSGHISNSMANSISTIAQKGCSDTLKAVQLLYPLLGMQVIHPDSIINRIWRDIHTASQHMLLNPVSK